MNHFDVRKNDYLHFDSRFQTSTSVSKCVDVNSNLAEVPVNLTAFRDWYWAGSAERRLFVHLVISSIVVAVPLGAMGGQATTLLVIFFSWDFGAWYMDKVYTARLARQ